MIALIIFVLFVLILAVCVWNKKYEKYGGPVKALRRIPRNRCYKLCENHYQNCMALHRNVDIQSSDCLERHDACLLDCSYNNYFRL